MQKTFKNQQGREYCFCLVPNDYEIGIVSENQLNYHTDNNPFISGDLPELIWLPQGNYQILCLAKDATDEQAASVVDGKLSGKIKYYYSYGLNYYRNLSAKESLTSLITSLGFKQDDNVLILEKI